MLDEGCWKAHQVKSPFIEKGTRFFIGSRSHKFQTSTRAVMSVNIGPLFEHIKNISMGLLLEYQTLDGEALMRPQ